MITLVLLACVQSWTVADDWDGDGFTVEDGDCSDLDPDLHPEAEEDWYDGVDQDCDGNDGDQDGDGHVASAYEAEHEDWEELNPGLLGGDCWDVPGPPPSGFFVVPGAGWDQPEAAEVHPGADDVWYDGVDQDCARDDDFDQDGDTWRSAWHPDGDGLEGEDCIDDDNDPVANEAGLAPEEVHPDADETWYDDTDQDCSDPSSWDVDSESWSDHDADGDGHPSGIERDWEDVDEDCDDADPTRYPDPEVEELWYDCFDQDCDGNDGDQDGDGFLVEGYETLCADNWDAPEFFLHGEPGDCYDDPEGIPEALNGLDDVDASAAWPGAEDVWYDGIDADCAGDSDFDQDLDGHLAADLDLGDGTAGTDCDDEDAAIHPDQSEDCATVDIDDNCDDLTNTAGAEGCTDYHEDADLDGAGGPNAACLCESTVEHPWSSETDCDDEDGSVFPGAPDLCDGQQNDCDGSGLSSDETDDDGDGYVECTEDSGGWDGGDPPGFEDCDDTDATLYPSAPELCDGLVNDCLAARFSADEADPDGDGYVACTVDSGGWDGDAISGGDDCDNDDPEIHPAATEVCDLLDTDEDCNGVADDDDSGVTGTTVSYPDADEDGFGDADDPGTAWCDPPDPSSTNALDCDDQDADVHPGATEVWYDDVDQDCAGDSDFDADGDGEERDVDGGLDCDDADDAINTSATEVCDGLVDEDCDGLVDDEDDSVTGTSPYYADSDDDGYGDPDVSAEFCVPPSGYVDDTLDCDDSRDDVYDGAAEVCDAVDNDCDTSIDEDTTDTDGDGTCDDLDAEECDGLDNDGDGDIDEDMTDTDGDGTCDALDTEECDDLDNDGDGDIDESGAVGEVRWYPDGDGDGYGDAGSSGVLGCDGPPGALTDNTDCDDTSSVAASTYPGAAPEDSSTDCLTDADGDGYGSDSPGSGVTAGTDCDDDDSGVSPAADEVCDGATDENCDGSVDEAGAVDPTTWYRDADEDGFGDASDTVDACEVPTGYTSDASDCDDDPATGGETAPGAAEADSSTDCMRDDDLDGFGSEDVTGAIVPGTDCDDSLDVVNPGASEVCDGALDENCDGEVDEDSASDAGTWYIDADLDGYGSSDATTTACDLPSGYAVNPLDCDDSAADVYPAAPEVDDSVDQDCDDLVDEDFATAGDLLLTELMLDPVNVEPDGEWFEVYNPGSSDLYADGIYVESTCAAATGFYLGVDGLVVPASDYAVLCYSDAVLGSGCDYVYGSDVNGSSRAGDTFDTGFCLRNTSADLTLSLAGVVLDVVSYEDGLSGWPSVVEGYSLVLDAASYSDTDNDDGTNWCYPWTGGEEYDTGYGDHGSPGSQGSCEPTAPN